MIVIRSDEHMSVIRGPADPEGAEVDWEVMERHAKTEMSMVGRDGAQVERQTRQNSAWRGRTGIAIGNSYYKVQSYR